MDELTKRIQADAALLNADNAQDLEFSEDTTPEAVARRQKEIEMSDAVSKLLVDDEDQEEDPLEAFAGRITALETITPEAALSAASETGIREDKAIVVLVQLLLNDKILTENQIKLHTPTLSAFLKNEKCHKALLGSIERLVAELHPQLLPRVALILKEIYEADLIEESVFLAWAEKPSKKYVSKEKSKAVREKAELFIAWLRDAEEESEDDE